MQINCLHCGRPFTVRTEQLGGRGHCPHCQREIRLPSAQEPAAAPSAPVEPSHWWENSVSGLVSGVFHMLLLLGLALFSFSSGSGAGPGEEVLIGELPSPLLGPSQAEELSAEAPSATQASAAETLEVAPPVPISAVTEAAGEESVALLSPSAGGSSSREFDLGAVSIGGGSMAGGTFEGMLQNLRRHGLDIVLTFDSTNSMSGEIRAVQSQIRRIASTLLKLVPRARIGLCTYRDEGDEYVVRGLPLTNDLQAIDQFLAQTYADGGGDEPEAVERGLEWAMTQNQFYPGARKVILLFGDAPPHSQNLPKCLKLAENFQRSQKGIVSTVTCRHREPLPEFYQIARHGAGEAFLSANQREIMTQLVVLVFGSTHRDKVIEAFQLMER